MNHLSKLYASPELYPIGIDFRRESVKFVRMSRDAYRDSVFLDARTRRLGNESYEIRLDDLLFAAEGKPALAQAVHYILHPTFCCSTLLARYFELLSCCFVLKEPVVLTQLALTPRSTLRWNEAFMLCTRLLTRTYDPNQFVVIKPHEPCNVLAEALLEQNKAATITFLTTPLRDFLLAILKEQDRRRWVQRRLVKAQDSVAAVSALANVNICNLSDAQAAAFLWLVNGFLCRALSRGRYGSRVLVLDGGRIADFPAESLRAVSSRFGLSLSDEQLQRMLNHPSVHKYSKDLSRSYDASARREERARLENSWGTDADAGVQFAASLDPDSLRPEGSSVKRMAS